MLCHAMMIFRPESSKRGRHSFTSMSGGEERTVHASEIPEEANEGDDYPYQVALLHNGRGSAATLRRDE